MDGLYDRGAYGTGSDLDLDFLDVFAEQLSKDESPGTEPHLPCSEKCGNIDEGTNSAACDANASLLKLREKSRIAQRKYRTKQRAKLISTQSELEAVRKELRAIKIQKKEMEESALQVEVPNSQSATHSPPVTADGEMAGGAEQLIMSNTEPTFQPAPTTADADAEVWWLDESTRDALAIDLGIDGRMYFSTHPEPYRHLTHRDIALMASSTLADLWQSHVRGYAELLLEVGDCASDSSMPRLESLCEESCYLWYSILGCHPVRLRAFQEALYAKASTAIVEPNMEDLVACMQLDDQQRQQLRALRLVFLQGTGKLQAQREILTANLKTLSTACSWRMWCAKWTPSVTAAAASTAYFASSAVCYGCKY